MKLRYVIIGTDTNGEDFVMGKDVEYMNNHHDIKGKKEKLGMNLGSTDSTPEGRIS